MNYEKGTLWNFITQEDASKVSQNMYSGNDSEANYVESDLVNSYAWDTAIVYIQAMGNSNYANATRGENKTLKNTGSTEDEVCHIYDMAGNIHEWTTEYSTYTSTSGEYPCVIRGGYCYDNYCYATDRRSGKTTSSSNIIGFRPLLYIK